MDEEDLDRLQAAIDRRRRQLAGDEGLPTAGASSTVVERRAYGSGVLQLEKRGESGPYWYFHHRKDGKQKTVYLGKTDAPEIKLAQIKGGIGGCEKPPEVRIVPVEYYRIGPGLREHFRVLAGHMAVCKRGEDVFSKCRSVWAVRLYAQTYNVAVLKCALSPYSP